MIRIEIKGAKEVAAKLAKSARADLRESIKAGVEAGARRVERHVKEIELSGGALNVRSGQLRRSVHTKISDGGMVARVGTATIYALPHEDGATITPKNARVLAIPLRAALTRGGRSRGGPRDFADGFWTKKPEWKHPIFFQRRGQSLVALFVGVQRVVLKARRPFAKTVAATNTGIVNTMSESIRRGLPGA
jgi:hypothetical protein